MANRSTQDSNIIKAFDFDTNDNPSGLDSSVTGGLLQGSPVTTVGPVGTDTDFPTEQATREALDIIQASVTALADDLIPRVVAVEAEDVTVDQRIDSLEADVTPLQTTQADIVTSLGISTDTESSTGSVYARLAQIISDLLALEATVGTDADAASVNGSVFSRIQSIKDDITTLATRSTDIEDTIGTDTDTPSETGSLFARIEENRAQINDADDRIGTQTDLEDQTGNAFERIAYLLTQVASFNDDIVAVTTDTTTNTQDITTKQDLITTIENTPQIIKDQIIAVDSDVTKVGIDQILTNTEAGTGGTLTSRLPDQEYVDTHITKATAGGTMERDSLLLDSAPVTINLIDASQIIGGRLVFPYDSAEPNASVGDKLILDGITTTEYIITTKQLFGAHSWEFFTSGGFGADRVEAITVQAIEVPAGTSFESLRVVGDTVSTSIIGTDLTIDTTGIDRDIERSRIKFEKAGATFEAFGADIMHSHSGNTEADREMIVLSFAENDQAQEFADLIDADPAYAIGVDAGDFASVVGTQVNIISGSNNTLTVYFGEPFIINNGDELGKVNVNEVDIARIRITSTSLVIEEADGTTNSFTPSTDGGGDSNLLGSTSQQLLLQLEAADARISTITEDSVVSTAIFARLNTTDYFQVIRRAQALPDDLPLVATDTTGTVITVYTGSTVNVANIVAVQRIYRDTNNETQVIARSS